MDSHDEEITGLFKLYLQQLGYNKSTCYMLPACVDSFFSYQGTIAPWDITAMHITSFIEDLHTRPNKKREGGLSEVYIYHHVYAMKLFFSYLEETGQISYNPMNVMTFKRPKYNSREPLTREEVSQLFEAAKTMKEIVVLHLFYSCGLRRSEAEALQVRDIHLKSGLLYVREGKGHKRRAIPITAKVSLDIEAYYLQERDKCQATARGRGALVLGVMGDRMSGNGYNKLLKGICQRAGIERAISLHHLRHSIATHLLENGMTVEFVRDFLGHSYLEATQVYTKVSKQKIRSI